jgi:hypothetical protein
MVENMEKRAIRSEHEPTTEAKLDKELILDRLIEFMEQGEELEVSLDLTDIHELKQLVGETDDEFLANLASFAAMNGIDHEEFFVYLGILLEGEVDLNEKTE